MIVREKPGLWDLLTTLRGSIVPRVVGPVAVLSAVAALIVVLDRLTGRTPHLDGSAFAVFGIGLSLFLGFRNMCNRPLRKRDLQNFFWRVIGC